ncbi:hypothetical protein Nepgr_030325 [Nepenthes gracilis]|uniref:PHD-type domain-containing protein n=1 Tax=Nepenthes gracilis TaxID=150966 RepID=A0AAD3Y3T0_NEPGR|nr:hypothetical protein Nepgr_030325 [Nepenthes gracilis]
MEKGGRSGGHSGRAVNNKSSSGCLIIKKKHDGSRGVGSSRPEEYELKNDKKRPQMVISYSSSSDVEFSRRQRVSGTNHLKSGSHVYGKGFANDSEVRKKNKSKYDKGTVEVNFCNSEAREGESKRSRLDVYEFDEYDDLIDIGKTRKGHSEGRVVGHTGRRFLDIQPETKSGSRREFESGSRKQDVIYRRRKPFIESGSDQKIGADGSLVQNRFQTKSKVSISMVNERFGSRDEAIRLQGKNGVLKLMVGNKKNVNGSLKSQNFKEHVPNNLISGPREITRKNILCRPSSSSEHQVQRKPNTFAKIEKDEPKSKKKLRAKSKKPSDEESEDSALPSKLPSNNVEVPKLMKRRRCEVGGTPPERFQPTRLKEGKVKPGNGTEKQQLREKIRSMLVSAGWTIDYRPRRNRDYSDAVYINPTGTAYWSIIKAYDAYQKQLKDEGANADDGRSPFKSISEAVISKLTRQTGIKIERELKRKKRYYVQSKRKKKAIAEKFESDEDDADSSDSGRHEVKLSSFIKQNGKLLKGRLHDAHNGSNPMYKRFGKSSSMFNSRLLHGRSQKNGKCTLLVRNSEKELNLENDGLVPYKGKRTLLSWLIDSGTVRLSEKVHYMNHRRSRVMLEGWITRDGIHCGCCSKILSVSKFELHAASKLRQPFQNIYLSGGPSLLQCQLDAWNRQDEPLHRGFYAVDVDVDDPNDDTCGICGDGGDLICCDGCPSTFHLNCLDIEMLPPGDWHCPHCSCKFCGLVEASTLQGNETTLASLLTCSLCQRKYHSLCMQDMDGASLSSNSKSFCGLKCQELFEQLQKLIGIKNKLEAGLSWSLIHRTDLDSDTSSRGFSKRVEWNSKLAVALTVMDECFVPIIDRRSGVNLIHNVIYNCGSNFNRLDYSGFYTAILERGDEIISAASIRIHGTQLAEMPYIGTRHIYRHQGMFRRLFSAIESALRSLNVEKLIIPTISELMHTWTTVFGFSALEESHKQELKSISNMLVFPGTDMLQKTLVVQNIPKEDLAVCGTGTVSLKIDGPVTDSANKSNPVGNLQDCEVSLNEVSVCEAKPQVTCEVGMDDELSRSVVDVKVHDSSKLEKSSIDSPSKLDILASGNCKGATIEETQVADADLGSQPVCVSLDDASLGSTLIYGEETVHSASGSQENSKLSASDVKHFSSPDSRRNNLVENPVLDEDDTKVADANSVSKPGHVSVNDASFRNQFSGTPRGSEPEVSGERVVFSHSRSPDKSTAPAADINCGYLSSQIPHVIEMQSPQLDFVDNDIWPYAEGEVDEEGVKFL